MWTKLNESIIPGVSPCLLCLWLLPKTAVHRRGVRACLWQGRKSKLIVNITLEFNRNLVQVLCKNHYLELHEGGYGSSTDGDACENTAETNRNKNRKSKRNRTTFTDEQIHILQANFQIDCNPDGQDLERIADISGLSKRVVQVCLERHLNCLEDKWSCVTSCWSFPEYKMTSEYFRSGFRTRERGTRNTSARRGASILGRSLQTRALIWTLHSQPFTQTTKVS